MKLNLTKDEIHQLHFALSEVQDYFKKLKAHQKEHKKKACVRCKDYKKLRLKLVKLCDCIHGGVSSKEKISAEWEKGLKETAKEYPKLLKAMGKL